MKRILSGLLLAAFLLCSCESVHQRPGEADLPVGTPALSDPARPDPDAENLELDPSLTASQRNWFADLLPLYRLDRMPEFDAANPPSEAELIQYALDLRQGDILQDGIHTFVDATAVQKIADQYFGYSFQPKEEWLQATGLADEMRPLGRLAAWRETEENGQKRVSLKIFCYYPFRCSFGTLPQDLTTFDYELQGSHTELGLQIHEFAQKEKITYYEAATQLIETGTGELVLPPEAVIHITFLSEDGKIPDRFLSCKIGEWEMNRIVYENN